MELSDRVGMVALDLFTLSDSGGGVPLRYWVWWKKGSGSLGSRAGQS